MFIRKISEMKCRTEVFEHILQHNVQVTRNRKFVPTDLLLVSDSTFPPERWGNLALQSQVDEYKLMTIPTVIVSSKSDQSKISYGTFNNLFVVPTISSAILLFVNLNKNSVSIGCFACNQKVVQYTSSLPRNRGHPIEPKRTGFFFEVKFAPIQRKQVRDIHTLLRFWQILHSNLYFDSDFPKLNCLTYDTFRSNEQTGPEECEFLSEYYTQINCTNCEILENQPYLLPSSIYSSRNVFPFSFNTIEFTFQVIFPKERLFDARLTAYLYPFDNKLWLLILISICANLVWMILAHPGEYKHVLLNQISIIFEQECNKLEHLKFWHKLSFLVWLFAAILLRQFYTFTLYTFMTSGITEKDYPQSMVEVLNRDDFELILAPVFAHLMGSDSSIRPDPLENFYLLLLQKAVYIRDKFPINCVHNGTKA
ncbi:unnamed protein product [Orchesella dallaii]|uniref:Uncharacterized protein n=1 Tax=Orchesella dallaii TaxID=48710 RepID=A0ABP1PLP5_9HEXA